MPVNSQGYYVGRDNTWKRDKNAKGDAGLGAKTHAEDAVLQILSSNPGNTAPFLIVQDAFPCAECNTKFTRQRTWVVFKITANNGGYSSDHGLAANPPTASYPYYIWYGNGRREVGANRPAWFPPIPELATAKEKE